MMQRSYCSFLFCRFYFFCLKRVLFITL